MCHTDLLLDQFKTWFLVTKWVLMDSKFIKSSDEIDLLQGLSKVNVLYQILVTDVFLLLLRFVSLILKSEMYTKYV